MEAIDIIELIIEIEKNPKVAYNMSNVLKYLLRFRDKETPVKDLQKARWYLNRMTQKVEEELAEEAKERAADVAVNGDRSVSRFDRDDGPGTKRPGI